MTKLKTVAVLFPLPFSPCTDPGEALRLHNEVIALSGQLSDAEETWCRLQEQLEPTD